MSTADDEVKCLAAERYVHDIHAPHGVLQDFLQKHVSVGIDAVIHRVVHGGMALRQTCQLDSGVEATIERLAPLAPLHNPLALRWIRACREELDSHVRQLAAFDTAFYAELPDVARIYALPFELTERHQLWRYGFHGLAHQALSRRWRQLQPPGQAGGRVISLQLGAGCSATAIRDGKPLDTSMGFSPLEGLMMATRSGDIDPGLMTYLQRNEGLSPEQLERLLNEKAGLFGVSGISADMRDLLDSDEPRARLAVNLYCYRVRKFIGAYLAVLDGADAILFGGGVGENASAVRARILEGMRGLGIKLDKTANDAATEGEFCISSSDSPVKVWVIPVDEGRILAQEAKAFITGKGGAR